LSVLALDPLWQIRVSSFDLDWAVPRRPSDRLIFRLRPADSARVFDQKAVQRAQFGRQLLRERLFER
jgi:hypothetical protein